MRRVVGAVGRAFITLGVLILLFVAYQLWGTGILEQRAQSQLRDDFERKLESQPSTPDSAPEQPTTSAGPLPVPPEGEPVAIIRIPDIGVDKVVVEGTSVADLRQGPGHYAGTPLPGQIGNAAIAGHRTTYSAPFGNIDQLVENDVITFETLSGTFDYRVVDRPFVVRPGDVEVLEPEDETSAILTLTSCHPKYSARERIIVRAELEPRADQEAQAPPVDLRGPVSLDADLSGEEASRVPTLVWGVIVAVVGGLWWLMFHRYRGWTTWVAGALPFAAALFVFYAYLERVLPSNY